MDTGKPIDEDYIDVEKQRADVSVSEEERDDGASEYPPGWALDRSHTFDDSSGNGSASDVDEMIDENAIVEHDGRADTRTFYYPSEAPEEHRDRYERMLRWQEQVWESDRKQRNHKSDRKRYIDIYSTRLSVPQHQRERVEEIVESVNMSHMAHYSSNEVILAVISLVENERGRFIRDEDEYRQLLVDSGTDLRNVKNIRQLVREKSEML